MEARGMKDRKKTRKRNLEAEREQMRRWRAANPEKDLANARAYRARHPEKDSIRKKAWRKANPEKAKARGRADMVRHKEARAAYSKAYRAARRDEILKKEKAWRAANRDLKRKRDQARYKRDREAILAYGKAWRAANPSKCRANGRTRRGRLANAEGTHTAEDVAAQLKCQRGKCYYCKKKFGRGLKSHVEHVIPLALGGRNSRDNLVISCPQCNWTKNRHGPHIMGLLL